MASPTTICAEAEGATNSWLISPTRASLAIAGALFPLGVLAGTPEQNLNWMYAPFGLPQTVLEPLLFAFVAVPVAALLLFLPGDWITRRLLVRWPARDGAE